MQSYKSRPVHLDGWIIRDPDGMDCHRVTEVSPPHADVETAWLCVQDQQSRSCSMCGVAIPWWATFCSPHYAEAWREYHRARRAPGKPTEGAGSPAPPHGSRPPS
jgi:hypothetical protein